MTRSMIRSSLFSVVATALLAFGPAAQERPGHRTWEWDDEAVELLATLAIQDGGRVQPLATKVQFLLYAFRETRSAVPVPEDARFGSSAGAKLTPMEWGLDCLLFPEQAAGYPTFTVANDDVLVTIDARIDGRKKRDRYSFEELRRHGQRLMESANRIEGVDGKQRTLLQRQVLDLARRVSAYSRFTQSLEFARAKIAVGTTDGLKEIFDGAETASFSEVLEKGRVLAAAYTFLEAKHEAGSISEDETKEREAVSGVLGEMFAYARASTFLALVPPQDREAEAWFDIETFVYELRDRNWENGGELGLVRAWERLAAATGDRDAFREAARALHDENERRAAARGEYDSIEHEVAFYARDWFYNALIGFVLVFVGLAVGWLLPRHSRIHGVLWWAAWVPTLLLIAGIIDRSILRWRPPVLNLYDTFLFITAVLVTVALVVERLNRRRVAIAVGIVVGAIGVAAARTYEVVEAQDTMHKLVAVLDTNFWLATHVTTVTMGYSAGLLAGALAYVWLFGKLFGLKKSEPSFYRQIGRMVYGVICFGLIFSVIGTILGGIWANESWGRFWGWDPKENGALMIVLWELVILHARLGGMIRDYGLCLCAIAGNIVVAYSWWGVNLKEVGLHSYGFSAALETGYNAFYWLQVGVLCAGLAYGVVRRFDQRSPAKDATPSAESGGEPTPDAQPSEA